MSKGRIAPGSRAVAAASIPNLRYVIIALLCERPASLRSIKQGIAALQQRHDLPRFKQWMMQKEKGTVEATLKAVAHYHPPGNYVLLPGTEAEIAHLECSSDSVMPSSHDVHAKKRKSVGDGTDVDLEVPVNAGRLAPTPSPTSSALLNNTQSIATTTTTTTTTTTSPKQKKRKNNEGRCDNAWIDDILQECGEYEATPDTTSPIDALFHGDAAAFKNAYNEKYQQYSRLHRLLDANRKDFETIQAMADAASSEEERMVAEREGQALYHARWEKVNRWKDAFTALDTKLRAWRRAFNT